MQMAKENGSEWVKQTISDHIRKLMQRYYDKEIRPGTVKNHVSNLKSFLVANEDEKELEGVKIKWDKLIKSLPSRRSVANDRAPTVEEIRKLAEYPDRRMKPLVYVTVSAGIRIRAWEHLRWKHVTPIRNDKGEIIAAKLIVYDDDYGDGQYITFMSPESYHALKAWMDYRAQEGEEINGESYLMRDLWQTTNIPRGAIRSFAKNPRPWGFSGITKRLNTAWRAQGIRGFLPEGKTRHEFKQSHGLIKFHDTQTNTVMSPLYSELLRGHNIGLPGHYLRPTEQELLREYLKAVPLLTINEIDKSSLQEQVSELTEKAQEAERAKTEAENLAKAVEQMQKDIQFLKEHAYESNKQIAYEKANLQEPINYSAEGIGAEIMPPEYVEAIMELKRDRFRYLEMIEAHRRQKKKEEEQSNNSSEKNPNFHPSVCK